MTEDNKHPKEKEKKKQETENKVAESNNEENKKSEEKKQEKTEKDVKKDHSKKEVKKEIHKKSEAVVNGLSIHASKKHCMYICNYIKHKSIDQAMSDLNEVIKLKRAIPFKGEIPHRKGMMSGRYPIKASGLFIKLLKGLKGNVIVNGMDLDKTRIVIASSNWASRPLRSGRVRAKRTNVKLIAKEIGEKQ